MSAHADIGDFSAVLAYIQQLCGRTGARVTDQRCLLATARLRFGIWQDGDMALAQAIWGDAEVTKLTGGPFTVEDVAERLATEIANWRLYGIQYWPVFRWSNGSLAGCCGLRPRDINTRTAELGFQFCPDAWGQGYAIEAAAAVIEWARTHGFSALIAGHHPDNLASKHTLLRLGFSYTHDELYLPTGLLEPCYVLRLDEAYRE